MIENEELRLEVEASPWSYQVEKQVSLSRTFELDGVVADLDDAKTNFDNLQGLTISQRNRRYANTSVLQGITDRTVLSGHI
jgi:hypothetical protein